MKSVIHTSAELMKAAPGHARQVQDAPECVYEFTRTIACFPLASIAASSGTEV